MMIEVQFPFNAEVLTTLTPDSGRILSKLHAIQPQRKHLLLRGHPSGSCVGPETQTRKKPQDEDHCFVGSPVEDNEKELVKLAKRLKKEKVNVDIINFGEEELNTEKLTAFINTLNGKEGTGSPLVTVPPGPSLADALLSSPSWPGKENSPWHCVCQWRSSARGRKRRPAELLLLLATEAGVPTPSADESEEALLKMSVSQPESESLAGGEYGEMDTGAPNGHCRIAKEEDDYDVMQDPEFLQSVLENLPGVDPNNEAIRNAMGSLASQTGNKPEGKKDEEKKK
ncbi:hypothetical protein KUCAC02_010974 [Chaenocephalus aceratus]|uniref:Uncharacterized protein n=1 Tax=Chaenocephalus aceratus TaxID=36190 RepID=A0ACB9WW79_CHAAC|nr:hypothetical protein KUCAC02_010974 [Chaenocephalus aceratus]